jgi:hypothetical protein
MIEAERGYLIVASNTDTVDYVACARVLAKSIRLHHPDAKICLLTNDSCNDTVFDYIKPFPYSTKGGWADDWQVYWASPFRETIKLEADMIVPAPIDHWWTMLEHRDVVIAIGARDYRQQPATSRHYRKLIDANNLPDIYNAVTYWRVSQTAQNFFKQVKQIFQNWYIYRRTLTGEEEIPSTDVVYAMAAVLVGEEQVTLPNTDYPTLVHMKPRINGTAAEDWRKQLVWELTEHGFRINTVVQQYPFHYHIKEFAQELEPVYDKLLART